MAGRPRGYFTKTPTRAASKHRCAQIAVVARDSEFYSQHSSQTLAALSR